MLDLFLHRQRVILHGFCKGHTGPPDLLDEFLPQIWWRIVRYVSNSVQQRWRKESAVRDAAWFSPRNSKAIGWRFRPIVPILFGNEFADPPRPGQRAMRSRPRPRSVFGLRVINPKLD